MALCKCLKPASRVNQPELESTDSNNHPYSGSNHKFGKSPKPPSGLIRFEKDSLKANIFTVVVITGKAYRLKSTKRQNAESRRILDAEL